MKHDTSSPLPKTARLMKSMPDAKPMILVVDDEPEFLESLTVLLRDAGYDVCTAADGQQALAELRRNAQVRAIVLDVEMPVMNGATFRGEQLQDQRLAGIPLVLLTGRRDGPTIASALGATAWLQKPLEADALLQVLARFR